jgi:hypothetical protein
MKFAPIIVMVYDRELHFKRCIESLKRNDVAKNSNLFIAIDAPYKDEDLAANQRVVKYAKRIDGFKRVELFIREANVGPNENLDLARREVFSVYDSAIISEDDNIFSHDFLRFINMGLEKYKERNDIFSVCGYGYPIVIPNVYLKDVYIWSGHSEWGVGIWKHKWEKVPLDSVEALKTVEKFLGDREAVKAYGEIAPHYIVGLFRMLLKQWIALDGYICLYQFLNKMYSVFPIVSRVRNIGHDGSGINCRSLKKDIYFNQKLYRGDNEYELPKEIKPEAIIYKILSEHFSLKSKGKLKLSLATVSFRMGVFQYISRFMC